ncbi:baseplate J/gp47 family protein, partial [Streptococcus pneumoniae]|uniref:baseplate J/gp47 family protein n=1 Tax=Streptococcus pneumoniae TaxID=1313 RepID=UPI00139EFD8A
LVNTTDTITLRALEAGLDAKLIVGDKLTSTAPIALVNSIVTVSSEVVEPRAAESIEDYRQAAILAYQLEPQGGAGGDYRIWATDAQGVER